VVLGVVVAVVLVVAGVLVLFASSGASLSSDSQALAKIDMPLGGGSVQSVSAVTGPHSQKVPVELRGNQIWPTGLIPAGESISIDVVVKRAGWISWLSGKTQHLALTVTAPTAHLQQHYITVSSGPLKLQFQDPVAAVASGPSPTQLTRRVLPQPSNQVTLDRTAAAGTVWVAAVPRSWETSKPAVVSWFPAGSAATAVSNPAPGQRLGPLTPIVLTFSQPVSQALGKSLPPVSPTTQGTWHLQDAHTIVFRPEGFGYGLGAHVTVGLPAGVHLVGGQTGSAVSGSWTVPGGSPLRLQQLLAILGYLPLDFHYQGGPPPSGPAAEMNAAVNPPAGHFDWRYQNVPDQLRSMWSPGSNGEMTRGAIMAFQNDHGLTADGVPGPAVWKSLIQAAVDDKRSTFGYTFVAVNESSQSLNLWHNGHTVLTTPVNTGIASAPTATGTYPVYEHLPVTTMSGTNPDGSHYSDPGIPWVSYFNGGDALHGFTRAQYGSPQSLGCVEMPLDTAGKVYPYTPVGTLVHVY
jgi:lipoprotein-anchoring transpeptidase ErfK/SrfK